MPFTACHRSLQLELSHKNAERNLPITHIHFNVAAAALQKVPAKNPKNQTLVQKDFFIPRPQSNTCRHSFLLPVHHVPAAHLVKVKEKMTSAVQTFTSVLYMLWDLLLKPASLDQISSSHGYMKHHTATILLRLSWWAHSPDPNDVFSSVSHKETHWDGRQLVTC